MSEANHYGVRGRFEPGVASTMREGIVYFSPNLDTAIWAAELAVGEGPGRIYLVEPTGAVEDDPILTNTR